jgi:flagellar biosynthetic protein FliP
VKRVRILGAVAASLALSAGSAGAQDLQLPGLTLTWPRSPGQASAALEIVAALTVLALAPSIVLLLTCFTRIVIVLSLLRHAIGLPQVPPTQVIVGLALFLTAFVMAPVGQAIHREALAPYLAERVTAAEAVKRGWAPLRQWLVRHTRDHDLRLMLELGRTPRPTGPADVPAQVLVPAFVISELRTAFQLAFVLFVPFLVIDLVVAAVLMSMGMLLLPPVMVSLPLKLLLFVLADGWALVVRSLVTGYAR